MNILRLPVGTSVDIHSDKKCFSPILEVRWLVSIHEKFIYLILSYQTCTTSMFQIFSFHGKIIPMAFKSSEGLYLSQKQSLKLW